MILPLSEAFFLRAFFWDGAASAIEGGIHGFSRILLGGAELNESQNHTCML